MSERFVHVVVLALFCGATLGGVSTTHGAAPTDRPSSGQAGGLHPYHVSLTEMEWNSTTQSLEVAMWVWPADLEKSLSKQLGRAVDLDTEKDLDKKLAELVDRNFIVTLKQVQSDSDSSSVTDETTNETSTKSPIRWVGHELDAKRAWLYFEIKNVAKDAEFSLSNRMFFELNEDQLNQLNAQLDGHEQRLTFTTESPTEKMTIRANTKD